MSRLTEQEQQEVVRFIEADKPLPDKYRFLLFDDKREVELVYQGVVHGVLRAEYVCSQHVDWSHACLV